jgi:hypothetical protein
MFQYTKDKITGEEILKTLYEQHGRQLYILPLVASGEYDYQTTLVKYHCTRCTFQGFSTSKKLLESFDQGIPLCSKCGDKTDEEVEQIKADLRNRRTLEIAAANGDLNKLLHGDQSK